jgi:hypothetical protein
MEKDFTQVLDDFNKTMSDSETFFKTKYDQVFGDGYKDFLDTMPNAL